MEAPEKRRRYILLIGDTKYRTHAEDSISYLYPAWGFEIHMVSPNDVKDGFDYVYKLMDELRKADMVVCIVPPDNNIPIEDIWAIAYAHIYGAEIRTWRSKIDPDTETEEDRLK